MALLLCGFGAFFAVQGLKTLIYPALKDRPGTKLFLALAAALGISAALYSHRISDLVIYGIAGAGLSVVVHRAARLLSVSGDWVIRDIMGKRGR